MIQSLASNPYHYVYQISLDIVGFFLIMDCGIKTGSLACRWERRTSCDCDQTCAISIDGVDNVSIDQTDCRQDGFVR